jgi:hypothetical protein
MATPRNQTKAETTKMDRRVPCEHEHDFILVLDGITEITRTIEDALFQAGCDDATISSRSGRVFLSFTRGSPSLLDAILSAIRDVEAAEIGATILRVDDCNLVTQAEIARKIGRSRQVVHQFISGVRGPGGFPPPSCHIADEASLWRWSEVAYWLWQNGMLEENALRDAQDLETVNSVLEFNRLKRLDPASVDRVLADLKK